MGSEKTGQDAGDSMTERSFFVTAEALQLFVSDVCLGLGMTSSAAGLVADSLVSANLRGVDSHGVHLLPHYAAQIRAGNLSLASEGRVILESGCCLVFDGENGLGQVISDRCCKEAIRLAENAGLGMVVARNSNHFGAAAFWAQQISASGMIGLVMCNASPTVPPWQGKQGRIGTNPICVSIPSSGAGSWLLDMSTTTVALNKIVKAASEGNASIPSGWAMDSEGIPTTDTSVALKGLLMPLGGYKGSGLGMLVEIFCAVLGGGAMSCEVGGLYIQDRNMRVSQTFLAIDVERFLPLEVFQSRMEEVIRQVKSSNSAEGFDEILVAGDPERRFERLRRREGIPIGEKLWRNLSDLAGSLSVKLPE